MLQLERTIERMKGVRVLVVGDVILDEYIWGNARRISREAPVPIVEVEKITWRCGGAANAAGNVASLGGDVRLFGVVGEDLEAERLRECLAQLGVKTDNLVSAPRPTAVKTRIVAQNQQIVRVDRVGEAALRPGIAKEFCERVMEGVEEAEAVLFSDYDGGSIWPELTAAVLARAEGKVVTADPKPNNLAMFRGFTLISPNVGEAAALTGVTVRGEEDVERVGRRIMEMAGPRYLLLTRGERGMSLFQQGKETLHIPAVASEVYDVTGAGDTVIACATLGLAAGAGAAEAAALANHAASIVVRRVGTAQANARELLASLKEGRFSSGNRAEEKKQ